jgi:hypothetical protein
MFLRFSPRLELRTLAGFNPLNVVKPLVFVIGRRCVVCSVRSKYFKQGELSDSC